MGTTDWRENTFALVRSDQPDEVLVLPHGRAVYRGHAAAVSAAYELIDKALVPPGTKLRVRQCTVLPDGVRWL